jgi:chromosome segregation ATPase
MSFLDAQSFNKSQQQEASTIKTVARRYRKNAIEVSIKELEEEIQLFYEDEDKCDSEILPLDREVAEIETKVKQLQRIAEFSQKFQELQQEIQDDRDLIDALYISIFSVAE